MECAKRDRFLRRFGGMAKDRTNQGGPTRSPKDEPTDDRDNRNAASRDELKERSVKGARPGIGQRNGTPRHGHR
jgi:hypothetical protein